MTENDRKQKIKSIEGHMSRYSKIIAITTLIQGDISHIGVHGKTGIF
jgi:hypothetical protein